MLINNADPPLEASVIVCPISYSTGIIMRVPSVPPNID